MGIALKCPYTGPYVMVQIIIVPLDNKLGAPKTTQTYGSYILGKGPI